MTILGEGRGYWDKVSSHGYLYLYVLGGYNHNKVKE